MTVIEIANHLASTGGASIDCCGLTRRRNAPGWSRAQEWLNRFETTFNSVGTLVAGMAECYSRRNRHSAASAHSHRSHSSFRLGVSFYHYSQRQSSRKQRHKMKQQDRQWQDR